MTKIKQLTILAQEFNEMADKQEGEYGGKGPLILPPTHKGCMPITKGGSSCSNCRFVDADNHSCKNKYYITWNGGDDKLPDLPLDEICSDWWEAQ